MFGDRVTSVMLNYEGGVTSGEHHEHCNRNDHVERPKRDYSTFKLILPSMLSLTLVSLTLVTSQSLTHGLQCVCTLHFSAQAMKYHMTSNSHYVYFAWEMKRVTEDSFVIYHLAGSLRGGYAIWRIYAQSWLNIFIVNITQLSVLCIYLLWDHRSVTGQRISDSTWVIVKIHQLCVYIALVEKWWIDQMVNLYMYLYNQTWVFPTQAHEC